MDLPAAVLARWFAELTRCSAVTASFALLLWSVLPYAWQRRVASWQRCGVQKHPPLPGSTYTEQASRAPQGWPRLARGRGQAASTRNTRILLPWLLRASAGALADSVGLLCALPEDAPTGQPVNQRQE